MWRRNIRGKNQLHDRRFAESYDVRPEDPGSSNALLFRKLAALRLDASVFESVDELRWNGPRPSFEEQCGVMGSPDLFERATSATTSPACKRRERSSLVRLD